MGKVEPEVRRTGAESVIADREVKIIAASQNCQRIGGAGRDCVAVIVAGIDLGRGVAQVSAEVGRNAVGD